MFPADTLRLIQETAKKAAALQPLDVPDPRRKHYRLGDALQTIAVPTPLRGHVVETLTDLVDLAAAHGTLPEFWHHESGAVLLFDAEDRRDAAVMGFPTSPQFDRLCQLAERPPLNQRDLLRTLRLDFALDNRELIGRLRKLEFQGTSATRSNVERTRESLGKEIMAQVQDMDDLPETVVIPAPVYAFPGAPDPYDFRLALEIEIASQSFLLVPLPGELDRARWIAQATIGQTLRTLAETALLEGKDSAPVFVFYGRP